VNERRGVLCGRFPWRREIDPLCALLEPLEPAGALGVGIAAHEPPSRRVSVLPQSLLANGLSRAESAILIGKLEIRRQARGE